MMQHKGESPEALAYMVADNKLTDESDWNYADLEIIFDDLKLEDFEVELTGFDDTEVMEVGEKLHGPHEVIEDDFNPDEPVETRVQPGEVWQLGGHRLMCGDSTKPEDVERLMDGALADMVFTDPPYGVDYDGGIQFTPEGVKKGQRPKIKGDSNSDIYSSVIPIITKFSKGPIYTWFAGTKALPLYKSINDIGGEIHALIIWVKNGGYGAMNANYKQKHEPCLYWKKNGKLNFIGDTTETTIWEINKDGRNDYHPTQKPINLAAKAIKNHKCHSVLDLFGGSGSTLMACEQLNRTCYMMELDPHYCDVIITRWEDFTQQKATKIS